MKSKIPIEISAKHIHLCREDFEALFGEGRELTFVKELSQPGQFLAKERLTIEGPRGQMEHVAILGPFRKETQVELAITDTRKLGIEKVIRQSGDIAGTPGCRLIGPNASLDLEKGVIVAKRHIHMTPSDAYRMHVKDNEEVFVITQSYERALIYANVVVRVHPDYVLAMHVDTDEGNAFDHSEEQYGVILKLFDGNAYSLSDWADELLSGIQR
ncbi:propanediol utilization protein PduL [Marvinbryantia formatexigens DSM 14469]|uniref:Phosphate propanoyltransferase n=1 Tax=Marvinbryantia formatexigens DSM 14469 TaxID=478749 RepID=C6L9F5_9FIRM|nr:phosphate propanoyltransferase [Marvinbryantia formatexigens]EET62894.1 propanediol utilization protein PduL [Marvinbryantia formatexigens DSM 14469]UWO23491.1 phosphate propanoyltransferase [Marvinbryantia formatexigens DSM 14469]SDG56594.1 putative phosphotransacetylase [Marvinbryantia formatexigens]